jgi:hypothetical protein
MYNLTLMRVREKIFAAEKQSMINISLSACVRARSSVYVWEWVHGRGRVLASV